MSSATSIKGTRSMRVPARDGSTDRRGPDEGGRQAPLGNQASEGFRPFHFFVFASLMTATLAVILARQATPEHLILISLIITAVGLAAAAFYRTLAPLAAEDVSIFSEPLSERDRAATEREKALVLRSIKELEFDRAMGKVAAKDFDEMVGRLRARAIMLMKQLDEGSGGAYREIIERELQARLARGAKGAAGVKAAVGVRGAAGEGDGGAGAESAGGAVNVSVAGCAQCGTVNDADAAFCKRCGASLRVTTGAR